MFELRGGGDEGSGKRRGCCRRFRPPRLVISAGDVAHWHLWGVSSAGANGECVSR